MTTPDSGPQIDGQWIDYYALLDIASDADEDAIRRRIGRVYSDAASNSDHRNLARRDYYRALVERILPQCRRVMLDADWRSRYDEQHRLHLEQNDAAQNYVEFIASLRSDKSLGFDEALLPRRTRDEINDARRVVEAALTGAELDLLPSQAISQRPSKNEADATKTFVAPDLDLSAIPQMNADRPTIAEEPAADDEPQFDFSRGKRRRNLNASTGDEAAQSQPRKIEPARRDDGVASMGAAVSEHRVPQINDGVIKASEFESATPVEEGTHQQPFDAARATVITAQEAADIRRRRASNPNAEPFTGPNSRSTNARKKSRSRVVVETNDATSKRKLSPASLNLMIAITGVLLTITIQRFANTPAVATSSGRTPIVLAVAPEMKDAIERASLTWESTPAGASYDIVVQNVESKVAIQRALGKSGDQIDGWIPTSAGYAQYYNQLAPAAKRPMLQIGESLAQTPMVLVARSDKAAALRAAFPDHKIGNWAALRNLVIKNAGGRFGLSDPRQSLTGAFARYSMAREWGQDISKTKVKTPLDAAQDPAFWKWMAGFEDNVPSSITTPDSMIKDMVLGTTGRYYWAVAYESDALAWIGQGKSLEIYYLPRTALADHPFCAVERVGAPLEVAGGRAAFVAYLKSDGAQKALLQSGFRPTEISPSSAIEKNPFTAATAKSKGVQLQGLPRDERFNIGELGTIQQAWGKVYG